MHDEIIVSPSCVLEKQDSDFAERRAAAQRHNSNKGEAFCWFPQTDAACLLACINYYLMTPTKWFDPLLTLTAIPVFPESS